MAGTILPTPGQRSFLLAAFDRSLGSTRLLFERYTVVQYNVLGEVRELVVMVLKGGG